MSNGDASGYSNILNGPTARQIDNNNTCYLTKARPLSITAC